MREKGLETTVRKKGDPGVGHDAADGGGEAAVEGGERDAEVGGGFWWWWCV